MISAVYLQVVQGEKINAHTLTGSHTEVKHMQQVLVLGGGHLGVHCVILFILLYVEKTAC